MALSCFVAAGAARVAAQVGEGGQRAPEDFAEIYVDRYFEPADTFKLSAAGENRARAMAHYSMGRMLENEGRIRRALDSYRKVIELAPGEIMLARKTANLLAQTGRSGLGRGILERSLDLNPDSAEAHIVLSEFLYTYHADSAEDRERSLELARTAVDRFPGDPLAYEHLVKRYLQDGDRKSAREAMDRANQRENSDPAYWLRLARVAQRVLPRTPGAAASEVVNKIYEKALAAGGKDRNVRQQVSDYFMATRQFDRAEKILTGIIEDHPDQLNIRRALYALYKSQGHEDKAIGALEGIVAINPQDASTHRELGQIYLDRMNKTVREAGSRLPESDDPDLNAAAKHLKKALGSGKPDSRQFLLTGELFRLAEKYDESIGILDRGAYLYPEDPSFLKEIADVYSQSERYDKAVEKFEETARLATQAAPEMLDQYFYFQFGAAIERAGDIEGAAKKFRKSIELLTKNDPGQSNKKFTALVYNYLGYMWVENDMNIDEGGELIKTALELDPESGAITDSLGWFLFKKEKFEEARKELLKAERILKEEAMDKGEEYEADAVILDHLGQAHWMTGHKKEAIAYMEEAVKLDSEKKEYAERLAEYRKSDPPVAKPPAEVEEGEEADKPGTGDSPQENGPAPAEKSGE